MDGARVCDVADDLRQARPGDLTDHRARADRQTVSARQKPLACFAGRGDNAGEFALVIDTENLHVIEAEAILDLIHDQVEQLLKAQRAGSRF